MWYLLLQAIDAPTCLEEYNYFSRVYRRALLSRGIRLVVTKLLKELWLVVEDVIGAKAGSVSMPLRKGRGVWIQGPMGTGKTTSLLYLHHKLKEKGFIVLNISLHKMQGYREYLAWFCKGKFGCGFHLLLLIALPICSKSH